MMHLWRNAIARYHSQSIAWIGFDKIAVFIILHTRNIWTQVYHLRTSVRMVDSSLV
jgi:hypothetical protein